jgi:hypothetical protein
MQIATVPTSGPAPGARHPSIAPALHKRLKQHHVAAWLGITPESLSRLRKAIALGAG